MIVTGAGGAPTGAGARRISSRGQATLVGRPGERGAVLVLFALGLIALLGAVGLGVDGSRLYEERRGAQAAVDHAAAAAAFSSCSGQSDTAAIAAGQAAAARNGYDNDGTTNVVTISAVGTNEFQADITSQVSGTFSRTLGFTTFPVSVAAVAGGVDCGASGEGPGAIFAGGTCPSGKFGVDINGSDAEIIGGVHSNSDASTSGSDAEYFLAGAPDDPFTYVGAHVNGGTNNVFQTPAYPDQVAAEPWPGDWEPSDITGALTGEPAEGTFLAEYYDLAVANGTFSTNKIDTINKDGVYYTTSEDGFDVGSITWDLATNERHVVLVATRGAIKISVSTAGKVFRAFDDASLPKSDVLMISNETFGDDADRCSKYSINLSGQAATWNGILWAPGGMIEFAGSDSSAVNGSLISWSVKLSGQYIEIAYTGSAAQAADPRVFLIR